MMKHLKIIAIAAMTLIAATAAAQNTTAVDEASFEFQFNNPVIKNAKAAAKVADFQDDVADKLQHDRYNVQLYRNNDVVMINIPASHLFAPNDTVLSSQGKNELKPIAGYMKNPGFYKLILMMHSDNSGNDEYLFDLTGARITAIFDWLEDKVASVDDIFPYYIGGTDPQVPNNSMKNREINRRLEIYLVPGEVMVEQAKSGKININSRPKKK